MTTHRQRPLECEVQPIRLLVRARIPIAQRILLIETDPIDGGTCPGVSAISDVLQDDGRVVPGDTHIMKTTISDAAAVGPAHGVLQDLHEEW